MKIKVVGYKDGCKFQEYYILLLKTGHTLLVGSETCSGDFDQSADARITT